MPRAKNGSLTKIGVVWQKSDFWTKNRNFGPKKRRSLFDSNHVLATPGKSCSKKKVGFFCKRLHSHTGQKQACTRITLFVDMPKMAQNRGKWLLITTKVKLFFRPDKTRKKILMVQPVLMKMKMMLGVDLKPLGIFSSLWTQTGPWSDTASYGNLQSMQKPNEQWTMTKIVKLGN